MKKKRFIPVLVFITVFSIFTFVLNRILNEEMIAISCAALVLSIFLLFAYENALKSKKSGVGESINFTKKYYQSRGELEKYQQILKNALIFTLCVAAILFICGLVRAILNY